MAHSALAVSAPAELSDLVDRVRSAGAPDAHERRQPPTVLADLTVLAERLERGEGGPGGGGLSRIAEDAFHPFFHEIADLVPADDPDERVTLLDELWPGYLLGSLLVRRAGVRVRAGAAHAAAGVATNSRLHWASWRPRRATCTTP